MRGVYWASAVWVVALAGLLWYQRRRGGDAKLTRDQLAAMSLLLGTHAIAGSSSADEVLANPIVLERIVRGSLTALAGVIVLPEVVEGIRKRWPGGPGAGVIALLLYLLVAFSSILYSVARVVSIGKAVELAVAVAIILSVALADDAKARARRLLLFVLYLEGALLLTALVGFFALPSVFSADLPRPGFVTRATMGAPFAHPNVVSALGAIVGAFALARYFEVEMGMDRAQWMLAYLGASLAVLLSSGRQGVAMWLIATATLLFIHRRAVFLLFLGPAVGALVWSAWDVVWPALNRQAPYHLTTLTGRIGWWAAALEAWTHHPWTGYGFGAGGRFVALTSVGASSRSNVHSGYIEGLVGVGLLGFLPLLYALVRVVRWSVVCLFRRIETSLAILIVPLALHTAIDLGFGAWVKPDFLMFGALVVLADATPWRRTTVNARRPDPSEPALL